MAEAALSEPTNFCSAADAFSLSVPRAKVAFIRAKQISKELHACVFLQIFWNAGQHTVSTTISSFAE
jgi:hypothetical protein